MKKILFTFFIISAVVLSACTAQQTQTKPSQEQKSDTIEQPAKPAETIDQNASLETKSPEIKTQTIKLYFYNEKKDRELAGGDNLLCSEDAVLPVDRTAVVTKTPIKDAINLLLKGDVTDAEKAAGFKTEFPNPEFKLLSANLKENGVLTLEFTEVPGFTDGGSCRVGILWAQIKKTAMQFDGVKEVKFTPETLFQP